MFKSCALIFVVSCGLCACESVAFNTNLDPDNFKDYYKASAVEDSTYEGLTGKNYKSLGLVRGLSCQIDDRDFPANEADARTDARRKAADMGANAVVFGKCVKINKTPSCQVSVTCYADALLVNE